MTLFERNADCGGHTLTDEASGFPVDLGFQVSLCGSSFKTPPSHKLLPPGLILLSPRVAEQQQ